MDNLTHALTGFALARTPLNRFGPGAVSAIVLGSNVPDLDLLSALAGSASYLAHHRELSHSIAGIPVLAVLLSFVLRATIRGSRILPLLGLTLCTSVFHVFMDLWTSYGTRLFYPLNRTWYAWDLLFIVDPVVLLLLIAILIAARGPQAARIATCGFAAILATVGVRAVLHHRAIGMIAAQVPVHARVAAIPTPIDPTRWKALADAGDSYLTGEVRLWGEASPLTRRVKRREDALVARVRGESALAAVFLDFSPFPWLEVRETPEGTLVQWTDLRYERPGEERFVAKIVVSSDGRIQSEKLRF